MMMVHNRNPLITESSSKIKYCEVTDQSHQQKYEIALYRDSVNELFATMMAIKS